MICLPLLMVYADGWPVTGGGRQEVPRWNGKLTTQLRQSQTTVSCRDAEGLGLR